MIGKTAFGLLLAASCLVPLTARAQGQGPTRCNVTSDRFTSDSTPGGRVLFAAGNVFIRCPARGITLRGDSAERYPDRDFVIGHVVYDEPRLHLTSDFLNHFPNDERVLAIGNVNAKLPSGSTMVGPLAEYKRASPRLQRPRNQLFARSRPTITIVEKDSAGKTVPPTTVVAENVFMDGDSLIYAGGRVVITRPEITATADSVYLNQGKETMQLIKNPELKGKKERPYTLVGDLIDLFSSNKKLQRVISRGHAIAMSDSMTLKSDTIDLRVKNDLLDHAYAWGLSRATVESPSQNLLADSLDVVMPGQRIRVVRAVRKAFAEGRPDSTRFIVAKKETDWLRGDTIIAHFDSTAVKDTSKKSPDVKNLLASGNASSFYHLAPSDSAERRPAINYVTARVINIDLNKSRVATVTTVDSVSGIYIEPKADSSAVRANASASGAPGAPPTTNRPMPSSIIPLPPKRP
ncbi:MAG TPA: hypothetical protein VIP11_13120 [Gemmatimonadaceae bacterium]